MNVLLSYLKGNFTKVCLGALLCALPLATACRSSGVEGLHKMTSINIIDRNGIAQTISEKERLSSFEKTDFLSPQPYQKVLRVFGRDEKGNASSTITSYHPNGEIKQYLEAVNNRAFGLYREWHPNGQLKIESHIVGGMADINTGAEESWLFDAKSTAFDEEGHLLALISYSKGTLEGESLYYHTNGKVWKRAHFSKNAPHGLEEVFCADGELLQTTSYSHGVKEGVAIRYWDQGKVAFEERYEKGRLLEGKYFDREGSIVATIKEGCGLKAFFGKQKVQQLHEYRNGVEEGVVQVFDSQGDITSTSHLKNGEKSGEEIFYFPASSHPRLLMTWQEGLLQGIVKTWYESGVLESQKEMSCNKKCGLFTAWYESGALMFVEEYDNDKLVKGEYYKMGENLPLSRVEKGKGVATLFDADGNLAQKVVYQDGVPNSIP